MADTYDISFIGSGNVAWHLAPALENAGHRVREVYSRNPHNAEALIGRLYSAEPNETLDFTDSPSSVYIISINDDAIQQIAREIVLPDDAVILHTSGSTALDVLSYTASDNIGVLYPLQTFSKKRKMDMAQVPLLIEAGNKDTLKIIGHMARSVSKNVYEVKSKDRMIAHISAVFVCNFTNYLYSVGDDLLQTCGLDFDILKPLIAETVHKAFELGPYAAQTGPAKRADMKILDQHMDFLGDTSSAQVYKLISQLILNEHQAD
ncbi:MAG: DUF2520 domain-containing protein [Cyclobacteriaceae bacterium]|nr:DUF2520 domain-containing protein [Cyclobacteriaceae bacterium]